MSVDDLQLVEAYFPLDSDTLNYFPTYMIADLQYINLFMQRKIYFKGFNHFIYISTYMYIGLVAAPSVFEMSQMLSTDTFTYIFTERSPENEYFYQVRTAQINTSTLKKRRKKIFVDGQLRPLPPPRKISGFLYFFKRN